MSSKTKRKASASGGGGGSSSKKSRRPGFQFGQQHGDFKFGQSPKLVRSRRKLIGPLSGCGPNEEILSFQVRTDQKLEKLKSTKNCLMQIRAGPNEFVRLSSTPIHVTYTVHRANPDVKPATDQAATAKEKASLWYSRSSTEAPRAYIDPGAPTQAFFSGCEVYLDGMKRCL